MSIITLNKAVSKAKLLVESVQKKLHEDAATVTQLTLGPRNAATVFVISQMGISVNTLSEKIKANCGISSTVSQTGDTVTISSNNPTQVKRVLGILRISATVQGDIVNDPMTDNPTPE